MKAKGLERYLNSFGKQVVRDSRELLQSAKGSTALGSSIRFEVVPTATGFDTKFYMDDYGTYLDKGVSGNKTKQSYINTKQKKIISPYSYTTKGPPIDILSKWIKKKGIKGHGIKKGRSKNTGQYISGFAYLISRKIKREGIKSISFFQVPLGIGYRKLEKHTLEVLKLDIQNYITTYYRPK
jgi:hypothetical protein|tara:strand:- start:365 stop:910 length:546 start_codon:yes stop_codon:yes gene_type:complete